MSNRLIERLEEFRKKYKVASKGTLSTTLYLSRVAKEKGLPLKPEAMLTGAGGQVKGLGKSSVTKILKEYGITRTLASEGGRTSRGSVGLKDDYILFLNELNEKEIADTAAIERWWIERVNDYFSSRPFKLRYDTSRSLRSVVRDLLAQSIARQREATGTNYAGIVLQHMVGAKLSLILPPDTLTFHGASVADSPTARSGDYIVDDVVIHCTTAPVEALIEKCSENIRAGLKPMLITIYQRVLFAEQLASNVGLEGRIEVLDFEQFIASNIYELSKFKAGERKITIDKIIAAYNAIIDACETDPSLRIEIG